MLVAGGTIEVQEKEAIVAFALDFFFGASLQHSDSPQAVLGRLAAVSRFHGVFALSFMFSAHMSSIIDSTVMIRKKYW